MVLYPHFPVLYHHIPYHHTDRENKLLAENVALKNQLDAMIYGSDSKKQAAEIERLKLLISQLQDQNNDDYDHKRRGDLYYNRCQQLEAELKALKEGVNTHPVITSYQPFNTRHPPTISPNSHSQPTHPLTLCHTLSPYVTHPHLTHLLVRSTGTCGSRRQRIYHHLQPIRGHVHVR